jgi:adenylate cyclase
MGRLTPHVDMNRITRKRVRATAIILVVSTAIGFLVGLLVGRFDGAPPLGVGLRAMIVGAVVGLTMGVGEEFLFPRWGRRIGYLGLALFRLTAYGVVIVGSLTLINAIDRHQRLGVSLLEGAVIYFTESPGVRDLVLAFALTVVIIAFIQVRRLHYSHELWDLLTGRYDAPREEDRIFLFADLVDSTSVAERLGHVAYSRFLRDCFYDVSEAIIAWGGKVYQHAGDGVIISWPAARGLRKGACVRCFWDMAWDLRLQGDHYLENYGTMPRLRGAVHGGKVVATWVGEAKKELAFHGDAVNATARIQAKCKEYGVDLLLSSDVHDQLETTPELESETIGEVSLRGKQRPVKLLSARPAWARLGLASPSASRQP